jgi:hypothetical protein
VEPYKGITKDTLLHAGNAIWDASQTQEDQITCGFSADEIELRAGFVYRNHCIIGRVDGPV